MKFVSVIFFLIISLQSLAQPAWLEVKEREVPLSQEAIEVWQENIFSSDKDLWPISNSLKFHFFLKRIGLSQKQSSHILQRMQRRQEVSDVGYLFSFFSPPIHRKLFEAYYFLERDFLEELSIEQIQKIYQYIEKDMGFELFIDFSSRMAFESWLKSLKIPDHHKNILKQLLVKGNTFHFKLPLTTYNWDLIPVDQKKKIITDKTREQNSNLEVFLSPKSLEEIKEIAKAFSGSIESSEIENYLISLWNSRTEKPLRINVLEILPSFMRYSYGKYSRTGGPNCFNCAMNTNRQSSFNIIYNDYKELQRSLKRDYRQLQSFEIPQVGDLIIYSLGKNKPIHTANYLPFDLTFSKNGIHKFATYEIQDREITDEYRKMGKVKLLYYRPKDLDKLHLNVSTHGSACSISAFID